MNIKKHKYIKPNINKKKIKINFLSSEVSFAAPLQDPGTFAIACSLCCMG